MAEGNAGQPFGCKVSEATWVDRWRQAALRPNGSDSANYGGGAKARSGNRVAVGHAPMQSAIAALPHPARVCGSDRVCPVVSSFAGDRDQRCSELCDRLPVLPLQA